MGEEKKRAPVSDPSGGGQEKGDRVCEGDGKYGEPKFGPSL